MNEIIFYIQNTENIKFYGNFKEEGENEVFFSLKETITLKKLTVFTFFLKREKGFLFNI